MAMHGMLVLLLPVRQLIQGQVGKQQPLLYLLCCLTLMAPVKGMLLVPWACQRLQGE